MDPTLDKPTQNTEADYGLEVLCASWNPLVAALAEPVDEYVAEFKAVDVESFLASFYRSQQG